MPIKRWAPVMILDQQKPDKPLDSPQTRPANEDDDWRKRKRVESPLPQAARLRDLVQPKKNPHDLPPPDHALASPLYEDIPNSSGNPILSEECPVSRQVRLAITIANKRIERSGGNVSPAVLSGIARDNASMAPSGPPAPPSARRKAGAMRPCAARFHDMVMEVMQRHDLVVRNTDEPEVRQCIDAHEQLKKCAKLKGTNFIAQRVKVQPTKTVQTSDEIIMKTQLTPTEYERMVQFADEYGLTLRSKAHKLGAEGTRSASCLCLPRTSLTDD